jgi:3-dehydroquinate dehydratase II
MNMRGKLEIELFGRTSLEELNDMIHGFARSLDVEVQIIQSNSEGDVVNAIYRAYEEAVDAIIINPAGFMSTTGSLPDAIRQTPLPAIEVHYSNPVARGRVSTILPHCRGSVTGFGPFSYYLALAAARETLKKS